MELAKGPSALAVDGNRRLDCVYRDQEKNLHHLFLKEEVDARSRGSETLNGPRSSDAAQAAPPPWTC